MKFGEVPIAEAIGAILAHKLYDSSGKLVFNKGHALDESDLAVLRRLGLERVTVTQLSDADLHEDIAAERIGIAVAGPMVQWRTPGVGRANLTAAERGVLHVDVPKLELINNIYDGITIATLREYSLVGAGDMVALVKVVPFGVPQARVVDVERIAEASAAILRILPLQEKRVALIVSGTEARRERLLKSFHAPVLQRVQGWGSHLLEPTFVAHDQEAIAAAIRAQAGADLILVASISAIIDREDIVPSALLRAGGSITLHGVPVDPGTLLMMGYLDEVPVVGAPGCVKSPKTNVIDWILPRLLTGERLTRANLVSMGHGGLLQDIAERPMPRSVTATPPPPSPLPEASGRGSFTNPAGQGSELPSVATGGLRGEGYGAIILAAGLSSRMIENKLLLPWIDGQAIISRVVSAYVDAGLDRIIVVTGRDAEGVAAALAAYPLTFAHNPDFAAGEILSSVKTGLRTLPKSLDAAFIQPGDMPCITSAVIRQLAAQHEPGFNVAPVYQSQRGHPVLLDRAFWRAMLDLPADARPRDVIAGARERLRRVEVDEKGVVLDIDTREAYERGLVWGC